jgi:hypothetical protein
MLKIKYLFRKAAYSAGWWTWNTFDHMRAADENRAYLWLWHEANRLMEWAWRPGMKAFGESLFDRLVTFHFRKDLARDKDRAYDVFCVMTPAERAVFLRRLDARSRPDYCPPGHQVAN